MGTAVTARCQPFSLWSQHPIQHHPGSHVPIFKNKILLLSYEQQMTAKLQTKAKYKPSQENTCPVIGPATHEVTGYFTDKQIPSHRENEVIVAY